MVMTHRLATIRDADLVVLLAHGCVRARGSFAEVVAANPDFARSASVSTLLTADGGSGVVAVGRGDTARSSRSTQYSAG